MRVELSRRLARAMNVGLATFDERATLVSAAEKVRTFEDLPADLQQLIVRMETPPPSERAVDEE